MKSRMTRVAALVAAIVAVAWAAWEMWRQLHAVDLDALRAAIQALPARDVMASLALTAASFALLGVLEALACRAVIGRRAPTTRAIRNGAVAHSLCNTLGFLAVLAPGLRLALYRREGVKGWDVARILSVIAIALGAASAIVALLAAGAKWRGGVGVAAALLLTVIAIGALRYVPRRLGVRVGAGLVQLAPRIAAVTVAEAACAMVALWVLLPHEARIEPARFVLAFVGSSLLGVVSHAPGGVGVFEAGMLAALPGDRARVLAALVAFRVVYNLLPACVAAVVLATGLARDRLSSTAGTARSRAAAPGTTVPMRAR
ncbi:UPF0104 family protein [Cognatilysobacter lacus]|uniref:UPF0104 family protein n=1 Tax=Cognatilysobacter lacus TaxID=1643323 RepID=A0A5D8Z423_9GAMM|nr:UPF0104 family protein [Lysobacter lacus]TZF89296.1 UPF0104 family protein [Lysobacter lacus]